MATFAERARKRSKELGESKIWKMAVGENTLRILPTPEGKTSDEVFMEFSVHENVGPQKKWMRCGIDPVTEKGKCFLCNTVIPKLRKKGKETRAAALEPKRKMAIQIATLDPEDGVLTGPKTWLPSSSIQKGLVAKVFDSKKRNYIDPKKGYNLTYKRVGTGMNDTEYFGPDSDDEPSKVPSGILAKLKPFEELAEIPRYSEELQKKAYFGEDELLDEDDDDDDDDEPVTKKKGKKVVDEDDDDEEDDEDESPKKSKKKVVDDEEDDDEEDDEDESPKKSKKKVVDDEDDDEDEPVTKKKGKKVVDDDEDDDEDDEDEDEPVVKKKGKKVVSATKKKGKKVVDDDDEELEDDDIPF